ncbi:hypothetical protein EDB86DRAFT_2069174 [Lactarius hatsudake]|nr:hypothetical protein EDB86DRAFT_2069174 [Lactarius hatsudake]
MFSEPPRPPTPPPPLPRFPPFLPPELNAKVEGYGKWLSHPDPSTSHGLAHRFHHEETSQWLVKGNDDNNDFDEWKRKGALFLAHGRSGAGKTILTSAVIESLREQYEDGSATIAYFYFEFGDLPKRRVRNLLSLLLIQLAAHSDTRRKVLQDLYSKHGDGSREPTEEALLESLKDMLKLTTGGPTFLVIDALNEALPSVPPQADAIKVIEELVSLELPDLRIFATSRSISDPEIEGEQPLESLASHTVCLHENKDHLEDIRSYIDWCIKDNKRMKRWRREDKDDTIKTLSKKGAGSWHWVHSQIKILPDCLPATVQRVLERMSPRYHITYARIMQRIPNENWEHAHRMFQFLAVCVRPLLVDELSEILTIDYDRGDFVTPKYEAIWHPETPDRDIFTVCRHTVRIDEINNVWMVKFAHVSVADWLFSDEILLVPESLDRVPRYQINIKDSHYVAALTCLAPILHFNAKFPGEVNRESVKILTMVEYAAENLIYHIREGDVSLSRDVDVGLRRLFDPQRPIFRAWLWLYDIDNPTRGKMVTDAPEDPPASSLYYAALCGFPRLVQHLANLYYPEYRDKIVADQEAEEEKVVAALLRKLPTPKKKKEEREKRKREKAEREAKEKEEKEAAEAEVAAAIARGEVPIATGDEAQAAQGDGAPAIQGDEEPAAQVDATPAVDAVPAVQVDEAPAPQVDAVPATQADEAPAPQANGVPASQADGEPAAQANGVPAVQVDGEPVPEGEGAPAAEGEGAAAKVESEDEDEDIVPDPPNPFDFVPDVIIPAELEDALSTRRGGNLGSALHAAAAGGHLEVVEVLLKVGANPREWDRQHRTPEQVALANGHFKIAELLSQFGGF